jgi:formylglycine-generating enzyme required for sulfatase activity
MRSASFMVRHYTRLVLPPIELVELPGGWFWMGRDDGRPGEGPRHRVWVDAFAVARRPVTNADYAPFLAAAGVPPPPWWGAPGFDDPAQPVVGLCWDEAVAYCRWLSVVTGAGYRLPTEAEWERAARGGLDGARFPWGDAHPGPTRFTRPPRVDETPANPLGLVALSGVCHEWCLDWESERYYAESPERNPPGPPTGRRRVSRGGAWRHQDPWSPVAHRSSLPPERRYSDYGLRVVRAAG